MVGSVEKEREATYISSPFLKEFTPIAEILKILLSKISQ